MKAEITRSSGAGLVDELERSGVPFDKIGPGTEVRVTTTRREKFKFVWFEEFKGTERTGARPPHVSLQVLGAQMFKDIYEEYPRVPSIVTFRPEDGSFAPGEDFTAVIDGFEETHCCLFVEVVSV